MAMVSRRLVLGTPLLAALGAQAGEQEHRARADQSNQAPARGQLPIASGPFQPDVNSLKTYHAGGGFGVIPITTGPVGPAGPQGASGPAGPQGPHLCGFGLEHRIREVEADHPVNGRAEVELERFTARRTLHDHRVRRRSKAARQGSVVQLHDEIAAQIFINGFRLGGRLHYDQCLPH